MAGLSNQTGTNWWEVPPPPQHKAGIPGEGIYAGVVVGKGRRWLWQDVVRGRARVRRPVGANAMVAASCLTRQEQFMAYEFDHNVRHGTGTLTYANSTCILAAGRKTTRRDMASSFHSDGSKYEGQWVAGVMDGQGTYTFADGCKYVGGYQDGRRHGKGIFVNEDGTEDAGEWSHGRRVDRTWQMFATQLQLERRRGRQQS